MVFTSGNEMRKWSLKTESLGQVTVPTYKEALLCGELPLCLKLMRREHNLQGWPHTARVEMETWNVFPRVHALLPSYFGMCFLEQEGNLVLGGSCDLQTGSAAITIAEKALLIAYARQRHGTVMWNCLSEC